MKWSAPEDNGRSPVTGYQYRQRRENEKFDETWAWVDGNSKVRETSVTDLEDGVTYSFQVRAVNKDPGAGEPSNETGATTLKPVVELEALAASVEEGEDAVFILSRMDRLSRQLSAHVELSEDGDVLVDGYHAPEQVTFAAGEQEVMLEIATHDDEFDEKDGALTLALAEEDDYEVEASGTAVVTVEDNDDAPQLTVADTLAAEDAGVMVFTVDLSAPSALLITVDYATSDGTATAGEDYTLAGGSVAFMPGVVERTISVLVQEDETYEGDESIMLTLSNPVNVRLTDATATGVIDDNDPMPELAVADARASEDAGVMVFMARLSVSGTLPVTVNYATSDGTARAGEDYRAANGSLTFGPGESERTISVSLLKDEMYETDETFSLTLSSPVNANLTDGEATGTIVNDDDNSLAALAWLSRFGRTVATQVVDTLESRFFGAFTDEKSVTVGGLQMRPGQVPVMLDEPALGWDADMAFIHGRAWMDADPQLTGDWNPDMRRWLSASSFHWTSSADAYSSGNAGFAGAVSGGYGLRGSNAARITYWGRGAYSELDGRDGDITLVGDVVTGILASDYEDERLLAGLALGYSDGDGSYRSHGTEGDLGASMVGIYPYARLEVTDNISAWAVLGYGAGDMKMIPESVEATVDTDIEMKLGAMGIRGVLLATETMAVALKSDAFLVSMDADATRGLDSPLDTDVGRARFLLEGSRSRALPGGGLLRPAVDLGLRYDHAADAETGLGVELGGSLRYSDPAHGLTMEAKARALLAHEESDYEEWGIGGYLHWDPGAAPGGFSLRLDSSWGAPADGANRLWMHQSTGGLASDSYAASTGRINLELGYGVDLPGRYGMLIPYSVFEITGDDSRTYRLGMQYKLGDSLHMSLDGVRRERDNDPADHALTLRTTLPW